MYFWDLSLHRLTFKTADCTKKSMVWNQGLEMGCPGKHVASLLHLLLGNRIGSNEEEWPPSISNTHLVLTRGCGNLLMFGFRSFIRFYLGVQRCWLCFEFSNPIGLKKNLQAYTQPYSAKHWKSNSLSTISISPLKFSQSFQTLLQIQLLVHSRELKEKIIQITKSSNFIGHNIFLQMYTPAYSTPLYII